MSGSDFFPGEGLTLTLWREVWLGLFGSTGTLRKVPGGPCLHPRPNP